MEKSSGMTLVEIILAIAIAGVIAVSIIQVFVHSQLTISRTEELTDASYVCQSKMEELVFVSENFDYKNGVVELGGATYGYSVATLLIEKDYDLTQTVDGRYLKVSLRKTGSAYDLVKATVALYESPRSGQPISIVESYLSFEE